MARVGADREVNHDLYHGIDCGIDLHREEGHCHNAAPAPASTPTPTLNTSDHSLNCTVNHIETPTRYSTARKAPRRRTIGTLEQRSRFQTLLRIQIKRLWSWIANEKIPIPRVYESFSRIVFSLREKQSALQRGVTRGRFSAPQIGKANVAKTRNCACCLVGTWHERVSSGQRQIIFNCAKNTGDRTVLRISCTVCNLLCGATLSVTAILRPQIAQCTQSGSTPSPCGATLSVTAILRPQIAQCTQNGSTPSPCGATLSVTAILRPQIAQCTQNGSTPSPCGATLSVTAILRPQIAQCTQSGSTPSPCGATLSVTAILRPQIAQCTQSGSTPSPCGATLSVSGSPQYITAPGSNRAKCTVLCVLCGPPPPSRYYCLVTCILNPQHNECITSLLRPLSSAPTTVYMI
ncbi:hypothetical protein J6590_033474 [Homalodisca vitripennis]|nr:hypothetical protein J6590_033474 [Homalodisca vitripennis]